MHYSRTTLQTLVNFDQAFDDSGVLRSNNGCTIGVFVTIKHFKTDSAARDAEAALSGLSGGFLG